MLVIFFYNICLWDVNNGNMKGINGVFDKVIFMD